MSSRQREDSRFTLSLAGIPVCVCCEDASLLEQIRSRYKLYEVDGDGAHQLSLSIVHEVHGSGGEEIELAESGLSITQPTFKGVIGYTSNSSSMELVRARALADLEYFLRLVYSYLGYQAGGFLIHSAGVVKQGSAYLFLGPSGSGKSTVAKFSAQYTVLNDDLVLLLPGKEQWRAYSTPFWNAGRGVAAQPASAPLAGIYRLIKDRQNYLEYVSAGEALADLMAGIPVLSRSARFSAGLLQRCSALMQRSPVVHLHFTPDETFWDLIGTG
jgi:hypothetical protein